MSSKIIFTAIVFLLMAITGIILSRLGHPLNKAVFAFHKIFTLLFIGLLAWIAVPILKAEPDGSKILIAGIATIGCIVLAFTSGALLSFEKVMPPFVTIIHRVFSLLVVISTIVFGWMVLAK